MGTLRIGDRAKVVAEAGDDRFPLGTLVQVTEVNETFGPGPHTLGVFRVGKANIVEAGLPENVLEKVSR